MPSEIVIVDGNAQSGFAGVMLPKPLTVKVTDGIGRPVEGQDVTFAPDPGAGSMTPATVQTNADGNASASWILGPGAGTQKAKATAVGGGAPANLSVSFTASAGSGGGSALVKVSGDPQTGPVQSALADSLVVRVNDGFGNPVGGVTVQWTESGGGSISPASVVTGADGRAAAERVLGPVAGTQASQASAAGLTGSPMDFTHTAVAANPTVLLLVSGDGQSAPAGFQLPESLVVRLEDPNGNGVGNRQVAWVVSTGAGTVSPTTTTTNANGFAATAWTLGSTVGAKNVAAVFPGLPSVPFTATATAGAPALIAKNGNDAQSGDNQTAAVGTQLPIPLSVMVTDAGANPVSGITVNWAAPDGGSVSAPTSVTDAQGVARVNRTLGVTPGTYTTTADVPGLTGSPVTFTSTATLGAPNQLKFTVQPTDAVVGQTLSPAVQVQVQDGQGNPIPTATNSITLASSVPGTLAGTTTRSAVAGVASFNNLSINAAGTGYMLTAFASGLASDLSQAFDVSPASTTITITSDNPDPSVVGQQVTINYDINILAPGAGSLAGTVTVSDGTQNCTGGINAGTGTGNCLIAFSSPGARTLTATYSGNANFNGSTSAGVSHNVNKASTTTTIVSDEPDSSLVGEAVSVVFTVVVNSPGVGAPTGQVNVTANGGNPAETCNATVSVGSCSIALTGAGNRTLTANYVGDANFNGDADTESHIVKTPTTTTVASSGASSVFGQAVTFTATVSPTPPTGTVQFRVDGVNRDAAVPLSGNTAQKTISDLSVSGSPHTITAVYNGSTTHGGSTGTLAGGQTVSQAGTTTTITGDSPDPSTAGNAYTVSVMVAAVLPGAGTPAGTVTVNDGTGGSCLSLINLSGGSGSCQLTSTTSGAKTLTAIYNGSTNFAGSSGTAPHQVDPTNSAPVADDDGPYAMNEDDVLNVNQGTGVLAGDTDPDSDPLTAVNASNPASGSVTLNLNGSFTYTPDPNTNGTQTFTYQASDGSLLSNTATVTITVTAVNDAPSFTKGGDQTVSSLAGSTTDFGWATAISKGPANESSQILTFEVSTDNDAAFDVLPTIDPSTGDLTYDPALLAVGVVTVTVRLRDNGGIANGGVDVSPDQTFTITITP